MTAPALRPVGQAIPVDPERLRTLWNLRPQRTIDWIARELGIGRSTLYEKAASLGLQRRGRLTRAAKGFPLETPRERGPRVTQRRCDQCGGRRDEATPHQCRTMEPLTYGLRVLRSSMEG